MYVTIRSRNHTSQPFFSFQFHDTFGMGVVSSMAAFSTGIRTLDSSIGGPGGFPHSPCAAGNVATEDILYALQDSSHSGSAGLQALVDVGFWISEKLGHDNSSGEGCSRASES
jgi:hydroxymethylglutaryl-CoA lyase